MFENSPELLAPAGSLIRLKMAILYGADAVYLGGQKFGLRSAADNFTDSEIIEGVEFAHARGKKVYVVLNSFMQDLEIQDLPKFVNFLEQEEIDAVICSDPGVIKTVRECSGLDIHLSTQATCINSSSALFWKELGVSRIILGRETSIANAKKIKDIAEIEVEMFIHGSMCIAYSGHCIISNFTAGRDSNRGGCAQSCRFLYSLEYPERKSSVNSFFMSSKDLLGIHAVEDFFKHKIDSVKIEGRMKSALYLGSVVKTYRAAIDAYSGKIDSEILKDLPEELNRVTHREYCDGNLISPAELPSVSKDRESELKEYGMVGVIVDKCSNNEFLLELRGPFVKGDILEVIPFKGSTIFVDSNSVTGPFGEIVTKFSPGMLIKFKGVAEMDILNIVRVKLP